MSPILFTIPGLAWEVSAYGFFVALALVSGWVLAIRLATREGLPADRIMVETDAPYLAPGKHRGKRNEPAYTAFTAQVGADLFGLPPARFAAATEANFDRLFTRAARPAEAA